MFIDFFYLLKRNGLPVSLRELLTLLEALQMRVVEFSLEDFYALCRATLVKHEEHLDRFDMLFAQYFQTMYQKSLEEIFKIPEKWLEKGLQERLFTEEEKAMIEAMGGLEKLLERLRELLEKQNERHEGGTQWIGTMGTSPFGMYGYNPEGVRIGEQGRQGRGVKVWDKRFYKNLADNLELDTRSMKMALRRLRILTRLGRQDELDMNRTIKRTGENAGVLDIAMRASKRNRVKVLILFDVGGSMDVYIRQCEQLFSAARYEFKHLEFYYFHNCLYESVWKDNYRRSEERIPTLEVLHKYNQDYKVILVGDASMAPYEVTHKNGSVEHYNEEAGIVWLNRLKEHFPYLVWLNPTMPQYWNYTQSINIIKEFTENRMFPLTLQGLTQAMQALRDKRAKYEE